MSTSTEVLRLAVHYVGWLAFFVFTRGAWIYYMNPWCVVSRLGEVRIKDTYISRERAQKHCRKSTDDVVMRLRDLPKPQRQY